MELNGMENQVEKLTFGEKLKFFFIKPQKVFAQFLEKPKYLINLLIIAAMVIITNMISSISSRELLEKTMEQQMQGVDPAAAQMVKGMTGFMTSPVFTVIMGLIGLVILVYVSSAIYYGLAKMFGGEGTYTQMVATYVLAYYPIAVRNLISAVSKMNVTLEDIKAQVGFGDALIKAFNVFGLWRIVLFALGISVVFKISKKKSFIIVGIIWAVLLLFSLLSVGLNQATQNMVPAGL